MNKFYEIRSDLGQWDATKIQQAMQHAMNEAELKFEHWKRTNELVTVANVWASKNLNWNPDIDKPEKITNGDMNITTNLQEFTTTAEHLFAGSGRRGNLPKDKKPTIENSSRPKMSDEYLSELAPIFRGTILEDMHKHMQDTFGCHIRIRCQNRPVGAGHGAGLYWHKDNPVENRFHIPVWTNPGHVLLFSERQFKWEVGFDPAECAQPMDFVGHYVPADGRVYEFFTKDYMHAVASVGVGWYQDRGLQTRCHLSFWKALN
jgi:hypothetical protein